MSQTTSQTMLDAPASQAVQLYSIRQSGLLDLKECTINGLRDSPKSIPSLLLWDNQGLRNFDAWTNAPAYYPKRCEWEILTNYGHDIASQFPGSSVVIELGCGNLSKTATLLAAMEKEKKQVYYYALDVSDDALYTNLGTLKKQFAGSKTINISGLSGTYDDCAEWLARSASLAASTVTFLWLGNSVANLTRPDASVLMGQFRQACKKMSVDCNFLISADSCAIEDRILKAYDPNEGPSRKFLFHGLHHANQLLGQPVFKEEEWTAVPDWNKDERELRYSYAPKKDVQIDAGELHVTVKKGEPVHYFMSGKWSEAQMASIGENAGLKVGKVWKDTNKEYCFYFLQSTANGSGPATTAERSLI